jgi:alpha-glucuronidase
MRLAMAIIVLLVAPAIVIAAGPSVQVVVADKSPPLERRAAEEIAAVLTRLYGAEAKLVAAAADDAENVIYVGSPQSSPAVQSVAKQWPEQVHGLKSIEMRGKPALVVSGGSPASTYWAAAELAHQLGVRSSSGDLDPVAPPAFTLKGFDIVRAARPESHVADGLRLAAGSGIVVPCRSAETP